MAPAPHSAGKKRRILLLIPFFLFLAFAAAAFTHISTQPQQTAGDLPSALVGKAAPQTLLPLLEAADGQHFKIQDFSGHITLVNFWGSWCPPCRQEHPVLMRLAQNPAFDLVSINYKDRRENALRFLGAFGNPFRKTGFDPAGKAAIDWGVYGPPETFVLGRDGTVLYRHIGPLTDTIFNRKIRPVIEAATLEKLNAPAGR